MTTRCAPACSQALPVKPQGVWARGIEGWAWSPDRDLGNLEFRRWGSSGPSSLMLVNGADDSSCLSTIYVSVNQISIGSDNGLWPIRWQAIIYTSAGLLSNGPSGTNLSEIWIRILVFSFTKMHLKMSSAPGGGGERSQWVPISAALPLSLLCCEQYCIELDLVLTHCGQLDPRNKLRWYQLHFLLISLYRT